MNFNQNLKSAIQATEKRLKQIAIQSEKLEREYQKLLLDLELTPELIEEYMADEDNFPEDVREEITAEMKLIDEKLALELSRIKDPLKTEQTTQKQGSVQPHWLFIR